MALVERVDLIATPRVQAHVPRPPQDVADADIVDRHFGDAGRNGVRGPWETDTHRRPRLLDETRTVEALGAGSSPAIPLTHLGGRELDCGDRARIARRLVT
jgi:hypothetical protein